MNKSGIVSALSLVSLAAAALQPSCSQSDSGPSGAGGLLSTGGVGVTAGSGGATTYGGAPAMGGSNANGGAVIAGGTTSSGGSIAGNTAGGATSSGGMSVSGGNSSSGGIAGSSMTGGAPAQGGAIGSGGSDASGGANESGGSNASGGANESGGTNASGGTNESGGANTAGGSTGIISVDCPGAVPAGIAASWCSCDQWGELGVGDAIYYNDIWGSGAGPQCIWVAGEKWGIASNHPSGGSVKAYPNISYSPGTPVGDINTYTSSFEVTLPDGGAWEATYDIWVKNSSGQRIEIMLWMMTHGSVFPASSTANPAVPNVDVGGHTWNVYYGAFGGNEVDTLIRTSGTASATVDVKAILDWLIANKQSFDDNWTLDQVQFGFEIVSDEAVHSYVVDSFSVSSS